MSLSLVPAEVLDTLIKIYEESQNTEITTTKIMAALSEVNKQTEIDNLDNDPRFDVVIEFEGKRYYQHKPSYQGKPYFEKYPDYRYYVNVDGTNDIVYVRYNKKGEKVGPVKAGLNTTQLGYYMVNMIGYMVHRMICEVRESRPLKKGEDVDHNNQNTTDNTASELTICSHAENLLNKQTKCRYKVDELPNNAVEMTELKVGKNVWKIGRKDANFEYHYYFAKLDEDDFDVYMTLNCRGSLKTYLLNYDRDTGKPIKYDSEGKRKGYILHHNSPELANKLYHNFSANNIYKQYK